MTSVLLQLRINANTHTSNKNLKPTFSHCYSTAAAWTLERNPLLKNTKYFLMRDAIFFTEDKQGQVEGEVGASGLYCMESIGP